MKYCNSIQICKMVVDVILTKLQNVIACKCQIYITQCIAIAIHCLKAIPNRVLYQDLQY